MRKEDEIELETKESLIAAGLIILTLDAPGFVARGGIRAQETPGSQRGRGKVRLL